MDSGATHHMTPDISNIQNASPYYGHEQVVIGNGKSLPVSHIGSYSVSSPFYPASLKLNFVLHAPNLSHNLISIAKLCYDNHAFVEFHPTHFFVKDLQSKTTLLQGQLDDDLYKLSLSPNTICCPATFVSSFQDLSLWHRRLGHPSFPIVR